MNDISVMGPEDEIIAETPDIGALEIAKTVAKACVGVALEAALDLAKHKNMEMILVKEGELLTLDYRFDRIRVWVDDKNQVVKAENG